MTSSLNLDLVRLNREKNLADLRRRQGILRDKVRSVARQYSTGLYLYGRPGTAKTYSVCDVLRNEVGDPFAYQRGHLTPVGLFELLCEYPDEVIVLDDLVTIFRSDVALQLLLSALEPPTASDRSRVVRYRNHREERRTAFRGGVICITNRELHDEDMLEAFKSRVHVLNYDPSDAQLGALMLDIAQRGVNRVPPGEAVTVAEYLIGEMLRLGCRFDIRLFVNKAIPDYLLWKDDECESDWHDLVTASIEEHLVAVRHGDQSPTRDQRKDGEHAMIREILLRHATRAEQQKAWEMQTGKSGRAFFRRLAEMK